MKHIIKFFLILIVVHTSNAQYQSDIISYNVEYKKENLKINMPMAVLNTFFVDMKPTFGGLFQKEFNQSKMMLKWQQIYNDFNVGLTLRFHKKLHSKLQLSLDYQIGMLRLKNQVIGGAAGYSARLSFMYHL